MTFREALASGRTLLGGGATGTALQSPMAVDGVGVNCVDAGRAERVARALRGLTGMPISAFPNAGMPLVRGGRAIYSADPVELARGAAALAEAGACLVGGCCGTGPDYVRELAQQVKQE